KPRREHQMLTQFLRFFVHGKTRTVGGNFKQYPARRLKIKRVKPVAVHYRRWAKPEIKHFFPHFLLFFLVFSPESYVVHRAPPAGCKFTIRFFYNKGTAYGSIRCI